MKIKLVKSGLNYLVRVGIQVLSGAVLFFTSCGTLKNLRGWLYFIIYFILTTSGVFYLSKHNPEVINERAKQRDNTERWDKVLLRLFIILAFFVIYIVAGMDIRVGGSSLSITYMYPGLVVLILSSILGVCAMNENKNFEATSRIQEDRKQKVCTTGIYSFVRHPGYLAIILWSITIPFIFGSLYTIVPSLCVIVIIVFRTNLEDKMLKEKLNGYIDYASKTRYRLFPLIW